MNTITAPPTDTELLDWIEREMQTPEVQKQMALGQLMQYVRAGLPLREAVQLATADPPPWQAAATLLLDRIWQAQVIARRADNTEVLVHLPYTGYCGWVPVTRLTPLSGGAP